jgi:hypothetical protein
LQDIVDERTLGRGQRFKIKMRRPSGERGSAVGADANKLQSLRDNQTIAGLHLMREEEQKPGVSAFVGGIDQNCALAQQVGVLLQQHVRHGQHQRVPGVHEYGAFDARFVHRLHGGSLETNPPVPFENRFDLPAVPASDAPVALTDGGWHVSNFESARFPRMCRTT